MYMLKLLTGHTKSLNRNIVTPFGIYLQSKTDFLSCLMRKHGLFSPAVTIRSCMFLNVFPHSYFLIEDSCNSLRGKKYCILNKYMCVCICLKTSG